MKMIIASVISMVLAFSVFGGPKTEADNSTKDSSSTEELTKRSTSLVGTSWYEVYDEGQESESKETFTFVSEEWLKQVFTYTYRNDYREVMWYYKCNQDDPNTGKIYEADRTTMLGTFVVTGWTFTIVTVKGKVCTYYRVS